MIELIYHCFVLSIALLVFFMEFTWKDHPILEILLKILGKAVPLFVMLYSGIQVFEYLSII